MGGLVENGGAWRGGLLTTRLQLAGTGYVVGQRPQAGLPGSDSPVGLPSCRQWSAPGAAELVGIRLSTVKRRLADLRARSGPTSEQLIYAGRAAGSLVVPSLEPASGRPALQTTR